MKYLAEAVFAAGLLAAAPEAYASGGVWCDAKDANLSFHFDAGQSRDGMGGWFGIGGYLETKNSLLPAKLARFDIKEENLIQRWLDNRDVRLDVESFDSATQSSVRLIFIARAIEELSYKGYYELDVRQPDGTVTQRKGVVACSAE
jgi:hypothetical protein